MKIESIETILVHEWMFVRITTDTGEVGIGQTAYWGFPDASERIADSFKDFLIGRDPSQIGLLWQEMYRTVPFRGGALTGAIAAVDIALWDLKARHLGVPIYELIGGKQRDRVRLHAVLATGWQDRKTSVDAFVEAATHAADEGFTAIKFDPFAEGDEGFQTLSHSQRVKDAVDTVAAVREAVGWEVDIALELHRKFGPAEALVFIDQIEQFNIYMLEDALQPDSMDSWGELATKVRVPMGAGERQDSIYEFKELIARGAAQFVRPDIGTAGGFTACLKIAAMAEAYHGEMIFHNYVSPLLTAATLQIYAALPNIRTLEYTLLDEQEPRNKLLKKPLVRDGGWLMVPDGPGLGVEIADDFEETLGPFNRWRPNVTWRNEDGSLYAR
ncbi:MAG: mandelate racemase/muconate lactonizing enzyme family protein [Actinomycetota bacterium]